MSLSSIELWQRIAAEGLASPMQCRSWAGEAAKALPAADTTDGLRVLQALIEIGKLTSYQAKILAGQSEHPLHRGPWTIRRRLKAPLWKGWLEVTKVDLAKGEQPPATWVRWLAAEDLGRLRSSAPSLPRGLQLAQVKHENLQAVFIPELVDSELQLQVAPVAGELLTQMISASRLEAEQVTDIIVQLAAGLAALHAAQLVHGRVLPDRIYVAERRVTLACDPIALLTATLDETAVGILGEHLGDLHTAHFLAPEFVAPGQVPMLPSDVYALGCTWWWLLTGRPPIEGLTAQQILASHTEFTPSLPTEIDYPEPLLRCLQHCLAKNLNARFASAGELVVALREATRVVAAGKSTSREVTHSTPPTAAPEPDKLSVAPEGWLSGKPTKSDREATGPAVSDPGSSQQATSAADRLSLKKTTQRVAAVEVVSVAVPPGLVTPGSVTPGSGTSGSGTARGVEPNRGPVAAQADAAEPIDVVPKPTTVAHIAPSEGDQLDSSRSAPASVSAIPSPASVGSTAPIVPSKKNPLPTGSATGTKTAISQQFAAAPANPDTDTPVTGIPVGGTPVTDTSNTSGSAPAPAPADAAPIGDGLDASTLRSEVSKVESKKLVAPTAPTAASDSAKLAAERISTAPPSVSAKRRVKRRKRGNRWILPAAGGFGFVVVLLLLLKLSGALEPGDTQKQADANARYVPKSNPTLGEVIPRDPRLDYYDIVASTDDLWVPPGPPAPLNLDGLPPGGQFFVALQPAMFLTSDPHRRLLAALEPHVGSLLESIASRSGQSLESIRQVTVAFYSADTPGAFPKYALRVELTQPKPLSALRTEWQNPSSLKVGGQELLVNAQEMAYYVSPQPLVDSQSISNFSVGPAALMREAAELAGGSGPLTSQMEAMWQKSDRQADVCVLFSPRYLFSEGRGLLTGSTERFEEQVREILGKDARAAMLQTRLEPSWYLEAQITGASDRDAAALMATLQSKLRKLPAVMEAWFVSESPHPAWRGLALRLPQMLRTSATYSRFGVENGTAIMNAYLTPEAAPNLLLASWFALQDSATLAGDLTAGGSGPTAPQPLTLDEYLARPIRLSFDQEPLEVALQLIADEANAELPPGTPKLRFTLDGEAFEAGGITRNQSLKNFNFDGKPVRETLTEVAKRGNPVTTVTDTHDKDQRLIWVVVDDPQTPGMQMISFTTRVAAGAAGMVLPVEFAAPTN